MNPFALYIHVPWCLKKCPYCDFNSHKSPEVIPEKAYIQALIDDLTQDLTQCQARPITSIFIGGGTPSLLSASIYHDLFEAIQQQLVFAENIEITLEANPGTVEQQRFIDYKAVGINRLSLGIQSFNPKQLSILGRIHDATQAHKAIESAHRAGFNRINLDIMHGLPGQSIEQGLDDLTTAIMHNPEHISWYQLTIEPNTVFYKTKPTLPSEDTAYHLEEEGFARLHQAGYSRYEISAFTKPHGASRHNLTYWHYGDYLGIGAGAHGKFTTHQGIFRTQKHRQPKEYLNPEKPFLSEVKEVTQKELLFEFMLNTTRLEQAIPIDLFSQTTGLDSAILLSQIEIASNKKLISITDTHWQVTPLGRQFTNDLQALFLS
jgi:putative oxygen-independent coproporphyrinogen III oxidase